MNEAKTSGLYAPETVRTMVLAAVWAGHHDVAVGDDEQIDRVASRILAAHPAPAPDDITEADFVPTPRRRIGEAVTRAAKPLGPEAFGDDAPTPPIAALHASAVERVMRAWLLVNQTRYRTQGERTADFREAVTDQLAQVFQVAACNLATNKDAAELLSAAEWLDGERLGGPRRRLATATEESGGTRWSASLPDVGGAHGLAPTLRLAILAAARSLGWPGGVK